MGGGVAVLISTYRIYRLLPHKSFTEIKWMADNYKYTSKMQMDKSTNTLLGFLEVIRVIIGSTDFHHAASST